MFLKFAIFSVIVIILGVASYVFVNNNLASEKGRIVINDSDIASASQDAVRYASLDESIQGQPVSVPRTSASGDQSTRMLGDLSTVSTTIDGYGNKTETRVFRSHSKLRQVVLQTSSNGSVRAYVYPHLGGVKTVSGSKAANMLSDSADQIALQAQVFETRFEKNRNRPKVIRNNVRSIEPMDSSEVEFNSDSATVDEGPAEPAEDSSAQ